MSLRRNSLQTISTRSVCFPVRLGQIWEYYKIPEWDQTRLQFTKLNKLLVQVLEGFIYTKQIQYHKFKLNLAFTSLEETVVFRLLEILLDFHDYFTTRPVLRQNQS